MSISKPPSVLRHGREERLLCVGESCGAVVAGWAGVAVDVPAAAPGCERAGAGGVGGWSGGCGRGGVVGVLGSAGAGIPGRPEGGADAAGAGSGGTGVGEDAGLLPLPRQRLGLAASPRRHRGRPPRQRHPSSTLRTAPLSNTTSFPSFCPQYSTTLPFSSHSTAQTNSDS